MALQLRCACFARCCQCSLGSRCICHCTCTAISTLIPECCLGQTVQMLRSLISLLGCFLLTYAATCQQCIVGHSIAHNKRGNTVGIINVW